MINPAPNGISGPQSQPAVGPLFIVPAHAAHPAAARARRLQHDVVDHPHLVHPRGEGEHALAGFDLANRLHRQAIDDGNIDDAHAAVLAEDVRGLGDEAVRITCAGVEHFLGLEKRLAQRQRLLPLARGELPVAHARRQPVGLAHRRHDDHFDLETQVGGHLAHHRRALRRLLAEQRMRRPHDIEQLRHQRRHPAEVIRPRHAVEQFAGRILGHEGRVTARINILCGRREDDVRAAALAERHVLREAPRIVGDHLIGTKLQRVDENRHDLQRYNKTLLLNHRLGIRYPKFSFLI